MSSLSLTDKIKMHLRENLIRYTILGVFFIIGVVAGAYIATTYETDEVKYLTAFMDDFTSVFKTQETDYNAIFRTSLLSGLKTSALTWILGFTIIGAFGIIIIIFKCGFMLGFINTFFISVYGSKGIILGLITIFAQCLIYIPVIFLLSAYGLSLSSLLIRMMTGRIKYKADFKYFILQYICIFLICAGALVLYSLMETYVVSNLIKWLINLP